MLILMKYQYYFFPFTKKILIARSEDTILPFTCEDIGVAMVTNMISQLQESFLLSDSSEISFTKWLRGAKITFCNREYKYRCLHISFITLYPSFIAFL